MELVENFIVEKNGKKYVYRSTSVYDPQTKRKRTVSEYIGKIDPKTGTLIEKKSRSKQQSAYSVADGSVKKYGASHALISIAESVGLRADLKRAFNEKGDYLLAEAISTVLAGGPMYHLNPEFQTDMTRELLGMGSDITPEEIHENVVQLSEDREGIDRLFMLRTNRVSRVTVFNRTFQSGTNEFQKWVGNGAGHCSDPCYRIVTDMSGTPVLFELCDEPLLNTEDIRDVIDRLIGYGANDPLVVMESSPGNAPALEKLIDGGVSFVIPAKKKTPAIKQMLGQVVKKRSDPRSIRRRGDINYIVHDAELAILSRRMPKKPDYPDDDNESSDREIVPDSDPRFASIELNKRIVAWACQEIGEKSDEGRGNIQGQLDVITEKLMDMDPYDAVDELIDIAGELSRFFELRVVEGELEVKIRQKAVTAALNKDGIFVLLSHGVKNWNTVMDCFDCRNRYERNLWILSNSLTSGSDIISSTPASAKMMIQYTALILWSVTEKRLRASEIDMPAPMVLQFLNTIAATGDGEGWSIGTVDQRNKKLFEALQVPLPKNRIVASTYIYDPDSFGFDKIQENIRNRTIEG